MPELIIDIENFRLGFVALDDTTKTKPGSARIMKNAQITDRGGVGPRDGTQLLGATHNAAPKQVRGFYNFKKSFSSDEILLKPYAGQIDVYSKDYPGADWFPIVTGLTDGKEFGFVTSLVNTDNDDYVIGCNQFDDYFRWNGAVTQTVGALVGAETAITVDRVINNEIYEDQTATGSSATVMTVSTANWATSQWVGFYIYFPSTGKIRQITANTNTTITFNTLGSDPGAIEFQVRTLKFPDGGTLIYNGTKMTYTTFDVYNKFPVSSAVAAPSGTGLATVPTTYPGAPQGNRLTNYLGRIITGNVRSALSRGSGGALQGWSSAGSAFVSKLNNPVDYSFSATRIAGEGDIISMPYGGGNINDVQAYEDSFYVFKDRYIEGIQYSQDVNDNAVRTPIKPGTGSVGKTIRGTDDIYFITADKQFTSITRAKTKDIKPATENLGYPIKRYLDLCDFSTIGRGIDWKNKIYIPYKSSSSIQYNDTVLVFNKTYKTFEGIWDIGVDAFQEWNGNVYYSESNGCDVYEIFTGHADVIGNERNAIISEYATHFMNLTPSKSNLQSMSSLYVEGYIRDGTTITFNVFKQLEETPFLTFDFNSSTDPDIIDGTFSGAFLGGMPLAIDPLSATFSNLLDDGRRHFSFRVYFPFVYSNFFSVGHNSSEADDDYEITRYGLGLKEDTAIDTHKIKSI